MPYSNFKNTIGVYKENFCPTDLSCYVVTSMLLYLWTLQSTAPARHWIQAYIIITVEDIIHHVRFVLKKE
jgi:hypothetical protein